MKHVVMFLSLLMLTVSCLAGEMPPSAKEMGCPNCHAIDQKVVGPAWMDVSRRYRDSRGDPAFFDELVKKVAKGGDGNWGDIPMVPSDPTGTKHDKIVELVKFVLALSDELPEYQKK